MQNSDHKELEQALRQHLARTTAPESLWTRIRISSVQNPAVAKTTATWLVWASAAAALTVAAGGGFMAWRMVQPAVSVEAMAIEALNQSPDQLDLKTASATEVRSWVRSRSNIDVPVPALTSKQFKILGANLIASSKLHGDLPVAEVAYQVGDYQVALLISKDPTNTRTYPSHAAQTISSAAGARVSSWSMGGQNYTLASSAPGEFKTACLLCHKGSDRAMN